MSEIFRVAIGGDDAANDWLICYCGTDQDDKNYYIVTNGIHGSDVHKISGGAKADAGLIVRLLNEYYTMKGF